MMEGFADYRAALYDFDRVAARDKLARLSGPAVSFRMCHPFDTYDSATGFFDATYVALARAMPDLECRDAIRISGPCQKGNHRIGVMGNVIGTFRVPFLGIPPTGQPAGGSWECTRSGISPN